MINFSENLSYLVKNSPLNISQISRKALISRPSLYDLINGKTLPKEATLERLIQVLKLPQKEEGELKRARDRELIKTNRKHQQSLLREKKLLVKEVGTILLSKGLEVSKPNRVGGPDLIIRNGKAII